MYRITGKVTRVRHFSGNRERDGVTTTWHRHTYSVLVADVAIVEFSKFEDSELPLFKTGALVDVYVTAKVNRYGDAIEARYEGTYAEIAPAAPAGATSVSVPVVSELSAAGSANGHRKP